jgi:para-nitrobenzyl esterase
MRPITTAILLFLTLAAWSLAAENLPRASADGETLEGQWSTEKGVAAFRGVPFAQPPLGELRWRKPQPLANRQALRQAHDFAPACMQSMRILDWYRDLAELAGAPRSVYDDLAVSEDCLYLNVWTPRLEEAASLPVMVWIHGGSNKRGWSYEPNYHGQALAAQGVVVVSIAYRLGLFGFFSPPGLEAGEGRANFGLWDQVAALEWVRRNIRAFGGDPERVTLFGESSGAENIFSLMFSPRAQGLFHRAILQSTPGHDLPDMPSLASEQERGRSFVSALGLAPRNSLQTLREMPVGRLFAAYEEELGSHFHYPVVDGEILERREWADIDAGRLPVQQLIIGSNANEAYAGLPETLTEEELASEIAATTYLDHPGTRRAVSGERDLRRALDRVRTAADFSCHSQAFAAAATKAGRKAWVYRFSRVREGAVGTAWGAYHGAEYPYVFNTHDPWLRTTDTDHELTAGMMAYWVRFARNGNPNGRDDLEWPTFRGSGYPVMDFGDRVAVVESPDAAVCRIYQARRAPLPGGGRP